MPTEYGLVPKGQGWFVLNARQTQWWERQGRGVLCEFEGAGFEGAGTNHTIVGAGTAPCLVLAVGARDRSQGPGWGAYTVDEAAVRHGAGVEHETTESAEAYARFRRGTLTRYRDEWLRG